MPKNSTMTNDERHEAQLRYMREYLRQYRRRNPDKVKAWRDAYTIRRAARLLAAQAGGGADNGGN